MSDDRKYELEIVESYKLIGEPRFRVKVKNTKMVINVYAMNEEEALKRAKEILKSLLKSPIRRKEFL